MPNKHKTRMDKELYVLYTFNPHFMEYHLQNTYSDLATANRALRMFNHLSPEKVFRIGRFNLEKEFNPAQLKNLLVNLEEEEEVGPKTQEEILAEKWRVN